MKEEEEMTKKKLNFEEIVNADELHKELDSLFVSISYGVYKLKDNLADYFYIKDGLESYDYYQVDCAIWLRRLFERYFNNLKKLKISIDFLNRITNEFVLRDCELDIEHLYPISKENTYFTHYWSEFDDPEEVEQVFNEASKLVDEWIKDNDLPNVCR